MGSVRLPQRQLRPTRCRPGPARPSSPLPRPPPPGRMRCRSARVGFGCVVAAERSCEPGESEPGGEGWSLHGEEPEEPPPLPTPPPQPPPPPPRRPPPGADGLTRSRRGRTRTSGRRHTAQHGPRNQAPLGGQLTGECAGREDHRAFQTVSDTRPGRRCPLRPVAGPSSCAELVRGPGPDPRTGAGSRGCLAVSAGVGPRRSGRGCRRRCCCCSSAFPIRRRLSPGLREAGAGKVPSRWRGGGGTRPCEPLSRLRGAGRVGPGTLPTRPPLPFLPHGRLRSWAASPAPQPGRSETSDPERVLCERAGSTKISLGR